MLNFNFKKVWQSGNGTPQPKMMNGTTSGDNIRSWFSTMVQWAIPSSSYGGGLFVHIGTGDVEPTYDDYDMTLDSNLTAISHSYNDTTASSTHDMISRTSTYRNNGNAPITIKEIGLVGFISSTIGSASAVYDKSKMILFARSVLETPITIGVGESYAFTYAIGV